jgi:hypothetical protein
VKSLKSGKFRLTFNVKQVSSNPLTLGVTVAMIVVFALPPKLSFTIRVSLLSR